MNNIQNDTIYAPNPICDYYIKEFNNAIIKTKGEILLTSRSHSSLSADRKIAIIMLERLKKLLETEYGQDKGGGTIIFNNRIRK